MESAVRVYSHYRHRNVAVPFVVMGALLVVVINFWAMAGTAMEVRLESGGMVEFVAPFRTTRIPAADIESIRPSDAMRGAFFVVRHRHGSLRFDPKLDGMHDLIAELKRHNPAIELRGI
jgi:hypothetical protein